MDTFRVVEPNGVVAASRVGVAKIMLILTLNTAWWLMVVTASIASTQDARHESPKPDERSHFA
jgi:hypothetical protein